MSKRKCFGDVNTVYSITIDLYDRAFSIAKGQPCEHEYETVRLSDLYAKEAVS